MTAEENAAPQKSRLEIWLTFLSSFAWPITAVFVIFMFRGQLMELTGRVKTGEFAGAKFEFSEAAAGYISASVDGLAKERNPQKREKIGAKHQRCGRRFKRLAPSVTCSAHYRS